MLNRINVGKNTFGQHTVNLAQYSGLWSRTEVEACITWLETFIRNSFFNINTLVYFLCLYLLRFRNLVLFKNSEYKWDFLTTIEIIVTLLQTSVSIVNAVCHKKTDNIYKNDTTTFDVCKIYLNLSTSSIRLSVFRIYF